MSTSAPEEPRASAVAFVGDELVVRLRDGRAVHVPVQWFPKLHDATASERAAWRLIGDGLGVHWPMLDEDISVKGLLGPAGASRPGGPIRR